MYLNNIIGFLLVVTSFISLLGYQIDILSVESCYIVVSLWLVLSIIINGYGSLNGNRHSIPYAIFSVIFFFIVLIEPLINIFNGKGIPSVDGFGEPDIWYKYVSISMLSFFIGIVYLFSPINNSNGNLIKNIVNDYKEKRLICITIIFFVLGLIPYLTSGNDLFKMLLMGRSYNGFSQFDVSGLANTNFSVHLVNLLTASGILSGFIFYNKNISKRKSFFMISIFFISVIFTILAGGRTRFGLIVIPLICYALSKDSKRFDIIVFAKYLACGLIFLVIISIMVSNRNTGFDNVESVSIDISGANMNREVIFIAQNFPNPIACSNVFECIGLPIFDTINKFLTNPIPRSLFSSKYLDPSFSVLNMARTGFSGFESSSNVTPTAVGRYYMLYGVSGVIFISILFSISIHYLSKKLTISHGMMSSLLIYCFVFYFVQSIRDFNPGWLYTYVGVLMAYFVSRER